MSFDLKLKKLRTNNNITQAELGEILGIARTTVAGYEQGKQEPSFYILNKISEYFDVSIDYLINYNKTYNGKTSTSSKTLGNNLRKLRLSHKYTLSYVASNIHISEATLSNYEVSTRRPDWETINLLCSFYNVSSDYLLGRTNIKLPIESFIDIPSEQINLMMANDLIIYILGNRYMMNLGNYNINDLNEKELKNFVDDFKGQIELLGYKYRK